MNQRFPQCAFWLHLGYVQTCDMNFHSTNKVLLFLLRNSIKVCILDKFALFHAFEQTIDISNPKGNTYAFRREKLATLRLKYLHIYYIGSSGMVKLKAILFKY